MTNDPSEDSLPRARRLRPVHYVLLGYALYILVIFGALNLPFLHRAPHIALVDHLFMATSAVSTTGLVTVNTPDAYNWAGQLVLLIGFQLGGLGYMTAGSVILLASSRNLSPQRLSIGQAVFSLPAGMDFRSFLVRAAAFTFTVEAIGALALSLVFWSRGVDNPIWAGIFHSVSAFCTAGFSVFPDSLMGFRDSWAVTCIVALLSLSGAVGFIVVSDVVTSLRNHKLQSTLTTRIILVSTLSALLLGWLLLLPDSTFDGSWSQRLNGALFQAMTSLTTVGFNTVDFATLGPSSVGLVIVLMLLGASPSGTGGGLKSTSWSAALAAVWSLVRGRDCVSFWGVRIPTQRLIAAFATLALYLVVFAVGSITLLKVENLPFEDLLFEAASALGTVGLSRGITAELTSTGKVVVVALMYIGRVGVLSLALSAASQMTQLTPAREDDLAL